MLTFTQMRGGSQILEALFRQKRCLRINEYDNHRDRTIYRTPHSCSLLLIIAFWDTVHYQQPWAHFK